MTCTILSQNITLYLEGIEEIKKFIGSSPKMRVINQKDKLPRYKNKVLARKVSLTNVKKLWPESKDMAFVYVVIE